MPAPPRTIPLFGRKILLTELPKQINLIFRMNEITKHSFLFQINHFQLLFLIKFIFHLIIIYSLHHPSDMF